MSNSEWNHDQAIGDAVNQTWLSESKSINKIAAERDEYRELLSVFIDATVLKGFNITKEQWDRACFLCGRWTPPFVKVQSKKK